MASIAALPSRDCTTCTRARSLAELRGPYASFKSIGTGFSKGLSHYFYGNYLDSNNPWGTTVSFGKIASQDVYKDICRFWRVLLVDLLPNAPEFIALFSDYFDWIRLLNNRHHTDATLARLDRFC